MEEGERKKSRLTQMTLREMIGFYGTKFLPAGPAACLMLACLLVVRRRSEADLFFFFHGMAFRDREKIGFHPLQKKLNRLLFWRAI